MERGEFKSAETAVYAYEVIEKAMLELDEQMEMSEDGTVDAVSPSPVLMIAGESFRFGLAYESTLMIFSPSSTHPHRTSPRLLIRRHPHRPPRLPHPARQGPEVPTRAEALDPTRM